MESMIFLAPFIPFLAMLPPSLAAVWIASRLIKAKKGGAELLAEVTALREEVAELRHAQAENQERLDFTERMLSQLRETHRELPKA
jgi:predicted nuclease with TOPRIM domain